MCLPKLYSNVILRSYDHIRYSEETMHPEGMGGASPFAMGLNALITRNVVNYMQKLSITGEWQEFGLEESAQAGRVPDGDMMLGLLVRAALDRTAQGQLKSFTYVGLCPPPTRPLTRDCRWTLNTKMLPTVWQGLASKPSIETLSIRMPSRRMPMPTTVAPSLPNLKSLKVTDIDPACYPDNISELLYHARKLEHLRLHFSPRMRLEKEPSVNLDSFFGRVKTSDYRMKLKTLALQNLYASNGGNHADMYDVSVIEGITMIDSSGGANDDASMSFVSHYPIKMPNMAQMRMLRGNKVSVRHAQTLRAFVKNIHKYFLITGRSLKEVPLTPSPSATDEDLSPACTTHSFPGSMGSTPRSLPDVGGSTGTRTSSGINVPSKPSRADGAVTNLFSHYLDAICMEMRPKLTHLLLLPQWKLSSDALLKIIRCIPKLREFGCAIEAPTFDVLRIVVHHLPGLSALRILESPDDWDLGETPAARTEWFELKIGAEVWHPKYDSIRWLGLGDLVFEVIRGTSMDVEIDGQTRKARLVRRVPLSKVSDVEIWSTDRLEI